MLSFWLPWQWGYNLGENPLLTSGSLGVSGESGGEDSWDVAVSLFSPSLVGSCSWRLCIWVEVDLGDGVSIHLALVVRFGVGSLGGCFGTLRSDFFVLSSPLKFGFCWA